MPFRLLTHGAVNQTTDEVQNETFVSVAPLRNDYNYLLFSKQSGNLS